MLVVDASAIGELLLDRPAARDVRRHLVAHEFVLHAPHLLDVEVLSVLRRVVAAGEASAVRAQGALDDLLDLPIERYAHDVLAARIWDLRDNFSAYDASYVALAEALAPEGAVLLTADARLGNATRAHSGAAVLVAR